MSRPAARRRTRRPRRGVATLLVLLTLGVSAASLLSLQAAAFRQAGAGRRAAAEVRAKWAARAGLEAAVARFADRVEGGDTGSAYTEPDAMRAVASGQLEGARFQVEHDNAGAMRDGPADAHAKVNINRMSFFDLMELDGMTEDVAAAILDWIDDDDEVREFGVEVSGYTQAGAPYGPRNRPLRSLFELDLVRGVDPADVRGEDWNLNGVLDPNEDDGDLTWPPDDADGDLDAGWSADITTESLDEGLAVSGRPRLILQEASPDALASRIDRLSSIQARVVIAWSRADGAAIQDFIGTPLTQMALALDDPEIPPQAVTDLTEAQQRDLIDEATMFDPADGPRPGRVNINTCSRDALRLIEVFRSPQGAGAADLLIYRRGQRPGGFAHIMDLLDISFLNPQRLASVSQDLDVKSHAYVVTSRGVDETTGAQVEIVATIERSALPIVITEMRIR